MSTPLTDGINALTRYANETTGASDTTLSDAVGTLVAGYGHGSDAPLFSIEVAENSYTKVSEVFDYIVNNLPDECSNGTYILLGVDRAFNVSVPGTNYTFVNVFFDNVTGTYTLRTAGRWYNGSVAYISSAGFVDYLRAGVIVDFYGAVFE